MLQLFIKGIHREHSHYTTPGDLQWISPYLLNRYSVDIYFISIFVPCCKCIWILTYQQGSSYLTEGDSWLIPAGWRSELSGSPKFNYKSCGKGNFEAHYCCCCVKCCCVKTISSLLALSHYTIKPHQVLLSPPPVLQPWVILRLRLLLMTRWRMSIKCSLHPALPCHHSAHTILTNIFLDP